jgi:putative flippase GtrA
VTLSITAANQLSTRALLLARRSAPRLIRFACTGLIAGVVQLALLHLWIARRWDGLLANTIAYLVSAQVNFILSATLIWGDRRDGSRGLLRRWVGFHGAILGTAILNQAVFVVADLALSPLIAAAFGIAATALVNFFVQDRLIFTARPHAHDPDDAAAACTETFAVRIDGRTVRDR